LRICLDVEVIDVNSRDIDDTLLLLLVAGDPRFDLACVTITPGTRQQVAVAQRILALTNRTSVPIGAEKWPENASSCRKVCEMAAKLGASNTVDDSAVYDASRLLARCSNADTTVITGSSLTNLAGALRTREMLCGRWIGQGGFASDSVVPTEAAVGIEAVTSYNLQKNISAVDDVIAALGDGIPEALLVSSMRHKGTNKMDERWRQGFDAATQNHRKHHVTRERKVSVQKLLDLGIRENKSLHDVLLLAVALEPSICNWTAGVELYRAYRSSSCEVKEWSKNDQGLCPGAGGGATAQQNQILWATRPADGSVLRVSYSHDLRAYMETVLCLPPAVEQALWKDFGSCSDGAAAALALAAGKQGGSSKSKGARAGRELRAGKAVAKAEARR